MSIDKFNAHFNTKWVLSADNMGDVLGDLAKAVRLSPEPRYLCPASSPIPGLPMIPKDAEERVFGYKMYLETPWGWARRADTPYYDYRYLSHYPLYQIVSNPRLPNEGKSYAALPAAVIPEPGYATLDATTGAVSVYTGKFDENTSTDIETLIPVWDSRISVNAVYGQSGNILNKIKRGLQQQGLAVFPTALLVKVSPSQYPWHKHGLPAQPAHIANDEVSVAMTGFAVNHDDQLAYVSLVGHKTACRSIWGSLNTSHRRRLVMEIPGHSLLRVTSTHNYASFSQSLESNGLYHLTIVNKNAFASPAVDESYCITPWVDDDAADRAFATRLDALLPIGIEPEWGQRLRQVGLQQGIVECCATGGDVQHAYRLKTDGWLDLVNTLLQAGQLLFS